MSFSKNLTISVRNTAAQLSEPLYVYEKDRNLIMYFKIMDHKYKFDKNPTNVLASMDDIMSAYVIIVDPNGYELTHQNGEVIDDEIKFVITDELIDEITEIGTYQLQFHIKCECSEFTIPPISFEVLERLKGIKSVTDESEVGDVITNDSESFIDEEGKLQIVWQKGDTISSVKLNQMVEVVNNAVDEEHLRKLNEQERVDKENERVTKENERIANEDTRTASENTRVTSESTRIANEDERKSKETLRQSEENKRQTSEQTRIQNEENRVTAENARVDKENERVTKENERIANEDTRTASENTRVTSESTRLSNEAGRIANEDERKSKETLRQSEENKRQTSEQTRIQNEENRVTAENARVDKENERVTKENERQTNEQTRIQNEENRVTAENARVASMSDITTRFNDLIASLPQYPEVIDARDGEVSLKARLDRDIEKAKQVYVNVEGSYITTDSSSGYAKDVEILGNTIQDPNNLADIRSVGDKVEGQELYEIPVLSVGKNLLDYNNPLYENKHYDNKGNLVIYNTLNTYKIDVIEGVTYRTKIGAGGSFYTVWKGDKFVRYEVLPSNLMYQFTCDGTYDNVRYSIFHDREQEDSVKMFYVYEGNPSEYEPYQEDKLTILSPVQLECVGDVADRIIEKDGVWGVEKNVVDMLLNEDTSINISQLGDQLNALCDRFMTDEIILNGQTVITDKLGYNNGSYDSEGLRAIGQRVYIYIRKEIYGGVVGQYPSLSKFKVWLKDNNINIKIPSKTPIFIPLPHDQQIKLRTFANKTNISFLTEIEGTIKAQVPKSLGATVNTHTEQINNLNKELDRVKKLEESTVSTVTTESGFTTVEATSNGYFEDVKLEGRTLVNLFSGKAEDIYNSSNKEQLSDGYIKLKQRLFGDCIHIKTSMYKPDTVYTLVIDVKENTLPVTSNLIRSDGRTLMNNGVILNPDIPARTTGIFVYKFRTISDFTQTTNNLKWGFYLSYNQSDQEVKGDITLRFVLVEGDHTQNPPSYFEGLKSVGQSATTSEEGVDEIVVSSVKGDGNLLNSKYKEEYLTTHVTADISSGEYVWLGKGEYCVSQMAKGFVGERYVYALYDEAGNRTMSSVVRTTQDEQLISAKLTISNSGLYKIVPSPHNGTSNTIWCKQFMINKGTTPKPYTPYQSDKKRLLYYNNETQSWEKPILREWDSIEKHADGKYYYHVRSVEVVLNGSEKWEVAVGGETEDIITYRFKPRTSTSDGVIICDKFKNQIGFKNNEEGIYGHANGMMYISILKTKASNIEGLKTYLQANNVTVVYQLAQEKVYECTNIDLITYANETNYIVNSGAIAPKTTLKVHNNISNVVSLLQKKVSVLESNITAMFRAVLAGDYQTLAYSLYPGDFNNRE